MSRAFVKESDREPEAPVARAERRQPYYMTPAGFARLKEQSAQASGPQAEELNERIAEAVVIDPASQQESRVAFGATVTIELPDKTQQTYQIVGEDEAEPLKGTISWISPLAQALWDRRTGARTVWQRPAGNINIRIARIEYV